MFGSNKHTEVYKFVHNFIPHPHHKTRAHLINNASLIIYSILVLLVLGIFSIVPKVLPGVLSYASDIRVKDLFDTTNTVRAEAGLDTLRLNPTLSAAARKKAEDMFKEGYWAHVSPSGVEPWYFILEEGYDYSYAGENLAKNFNTSEEVVTAWYQSPSHKENLLSTNYDEVGYAVVDGVLEGYETTLVVQMFGRPRNSSAVASAAEEQNFLAQLENEQASEENAVEVPVTNVVTGSDATNMNENTSINRSTINNIDVGKTTKYISMAFGIFLILLLALDIYHTKKKEILKFTGHSFAHILFLTFIVIAIVFIIRPGIVL